MEDSGKENHSNKDITSGIPDTGIPDTGIPDTGSTDTFPMEFDPAAAEASADKKITDIKTSLSASSSAIVAARGTIDGVVIRLDGRVPKETLFHAIEEFLLTRESFLGGSEVLLEWVGVKPDDELSNDLNKLFLDKFNITVKSSKLREQRNKPPTDDEQALFNKQQEIIKQKERSYIQDSSKKSKSLFDGMEVISGSMSGSSSQHPNNRAAINQSSRGMSQNQESKIYGDQMDNSREFSSKGMAGGINSAGSFWDDPDARLIYSTLRSGQKVETDHSLIIFGDVNSGAEVVAGGDIIVLGTLRGVAHAGAYDETGGGRVIFALNLQPTQLRIGMVISRSSSERISRSDAAAKSPEIAKVEDGMIIVEPYSVKNLGKKIN